MINSKVVVEHFQEDNIYERSFTQEQIDIIKTSIAPNLNEEQFKYFIYTCVRHNLDPIARQIYPLLVFDRVNQVNRLIPFVGIDGLRLIADRSNKYAPGKSTLFEYDDKGALLSATSFVKKLVAGEWHDVSASAVFSEYSSGKAPWTTKPHIMLEKCAEAKAIRKAFPADTSGLYVEEEKDSIKNENISSKKSDTIKKDKLLEIEKYFSSRPDLGQQLLNFCNVARFSDIKESQLEACKRFIEKKIAVDVVEDENENS